MPRSNLLEQHAPGALLLAAVAVSAWVLAVPVVGGVANWILALAIVAALVTAGWLSAWGALGIAVAPVIGEVSKRLDLNPTGGEMTEMQAVSIFVVPISIILVAAGYFAHRRWLTYRRGSAHARVD